MKRYFYTLAILLVAFLPMTAYAESTMTFVAGDDVCTPITVKVGGRSYKVYSSLTISQTNGTVTATDCSGRKLKYDYATRGSLGGDSQDTYTFHNTYDVTRDSGRNPYSNQDYGYNNNYGDESARQAGEGIRKLIFSGGGGVGDAYPSLQLQTGISRAYGVNARFKWASGAGFLLYGGVGKDWLFDSKYSHRLLWNAGMGSYIGFGGDGNHNMDVSFGLSFGQLAQFSKTSMMVDVDYTCWIGRWRRVGVFAGGSLGWGDFVNVFDSDDVNSTTGFAWNIEAGIVFRLANF